MPHALRFGHFSALLLKLIIIHEAWIQGLLLAAANVYREDNGAPVPDYTVSRTCGRDGPITLDDLTLIHNLAHFDRERIPDRVVHALGSGAFGYLEVTEDITRYCKAAIFQKIGFKTPVAVRFSSVTHEIGGPDVGRNPRGFAVKIYTCDGIWDICGNNTPIFFLRDPMGFPAMVHSQKRSPKTGRPDSNAAWDFATRKHEMLFQLMRVYSNLGTPKSFRHMDGFGSHTFVMVNAQNEPVYCKFHFRTNQGVENMTADEAQKIGSENPYHASQDLYEAIERGDFPSWGFFIQVMTFEQAEMFRYSVLDVTKIWPETEYPLIPVGKMVLNRNFKNFFHEIEQLAFCPSNLVPGIQPSMDRMLQARMFSYKDTQRHRLGANFMQIPVNRPLENPYNLERDGPMNMWNQGSTINYYPNSYSSLRPDPSAEWIKFNVTGYVGRYDINKDDDNYTQAREWYQSLPPSERRAIAENIAADMDGVTAPIRDRVYASYSLISPALGAQISSLAPPL